MALVYATFNGLDGVIAIQFRINMIKFNYVNRVNQSF